MKYYYAIFKQTPEAIEVEFPDLAGCSTFGENWEEAIENATDALAGWLTHAEKKIIKQASSFDTLKKRFANESLLPIPIDRKIMLSYADKRRINIIFPSGLLEMVDEYRKTRKLKRSTLVRKAVREYLSKHHVGS